MSAPDIRTARMYAQSLAYYAQELRDIPECVSPQAMANTVERLANAVLKALRPEQDVQPHMIGAHDE